MGTSLRGSARTRRTAAWVILADWATVEGKATSAELKNHNFEKRTNKKKRVLTKEDCETPTKGLSAVQPWDLFTLSNQFVSMTLTQVLFRSQTSGNTAHLSHTVLQKSRSIIVIIIIIRKFEKGYSGRGRGTTIEQHDSAKLYQQEFIPTMFRSIMVFCPPAEI